LFEERYKYNGGPYDSLKDRNKEEYFMNKNKQLKTNNSYSGLRTIKENGGIFDRNLGNQTSMAKDIAPPKPPLYGTFKRANPHRVKDTFSPYPQFMNDKKND
jgi:hypothetical protein